MGDLHVYHLWILLIVCVPCSGNATVEDLAIKGCSSSSAVMVPLSRKEHIEVVFRNMLFENNNATGDFEFRDDFAVFSAGASGGAIRADRNTTVIVQQSVFIRNGADQGGAIYTGGTLIVNNSEFRGNVAGESGGGAIYSNAQEAASDFLDLGIQTLRGPTNVLTVSNCSFILNAALRGQSGRPPFTASGASFESDEFFSFATPAFAGGAILVREVGTVDISSSIFEENTASAGGAVFFSIQKADQLLPGAPAFHHEIRNCTFAKNVAVSPEPIRPSINHGGAVFLSVLNSQIIPKFIDTQFIANKAEFGGALHMLTTNQNQVDVFDCLFEGNEANSAGQWTKSALVVSWSMQLQVCHSPLSPCGCNRKNINKHNQMGMAGCVAGTRCS